MNELNSMTFLGYPVGLLAVTIVITVIASAIASSISAVLAVRMMSCRLGSPLPVAMAAPSPASSAAVTNSALIAAISAAVYSTVGAHRIVYIGGSPVGSTWTNELRSQHHTSHAVPRVHHSND
jgi:hypothetical protein